MTFPVLHSQYVIDHLESLAGAPQSIRRLTAKARKDLHVIARTWTPHARGVWAPAVSRVAERLIHATSGERRFLEDEEDSLVFGQ